MSTSKEDSQLIAEEVYQDSVRKSALFNSNLLDVLLKIYFSCTNHSN